MLTMLRLWWKGFVFIRANSYGAPSGDDKNILPIRMKAWILPYYL